MVNSIVKERLSKLSDKELSATQEKLNQLCADYGMKPWKINAGKGDWRELVFRMLDILGDDNQVNKLGRPARTAEEVWRIGARIDGLRSFSRFDENMNHIGDPYSYKEAINIVAAELGLKKEFYDSGNEKDPAEVLRGIYYKFTQKLRNGDYHCDHFDDEEP